MYLGIIIFAPFVELIYKTDSQILAQPVNSSGRGTVTRFTLLPSMVLPVGIREIIEELSVGNGLLGNHLIPTWCNNSD